MNKTLLRQAFGPVVVSITVITSGSIALGQQVNPKVHGLCKEAKDYAGCVRAMTTDITTPAVIKTDQTNRPGLLSEMGNSCPAGYGYAGAGQCRSTKCKPMGMFGSNDPQLSGKGHTCEGKNSEYGLVGRSSLRWGDALTPASNDPKCPAYEPDLGDPSSCVKALRTGMVYTTGVTFILENNRLLVKSTIGTARQLGIQDGDIVVSINGNNAVEEYNTRTSFNRAVQPNEQFTIVFERSGRQFTHTLIATLQINAGIQRNLR
jgi:hypothetical protein